MLFVPSRRRLLVLGLGLGFALLFFNLASSATNSTISKCPIDFTFVDSFPWAGITCQEQLSADNSCCNALLSTFGIGLAQYLKDTGFFELPDLSTVFACLSSFQTSLQKNDLTFNATGACFIDPGSQYNASMFVKSPKLCSGIETSSDWLQKIGDLPCGTDLSDLAACTICSNYAVTAISKAKALSNDTSSCIYFYVLYGAGISSPKGPKDPATAQCLLGVQEWSNGNKKSVPTVFIAVGAIVGLVLGFSIAVILWLWLKRRGWLAHRDFVNRNSKLVKGLLPNTGAVWYKLPQIKQATNGFSKDNLVGQGGFAKVYKGLTPDGLEIAVKVLQNTTPDGDAEFLNEVEVIKNVRHKNLVTLRGCCVASTDADGHCRLLVYDYMRNGSLYDYLFDKTKPPLTWPQRRKIILGMAKGIAYLHTGVQPAIIHRDIKASNVLLDSDLQAKVADFGLAKITEEGLSHLTTRVAGTQGYVAPEYALYGQLTEKSDVYSFGVVILELLSGRRALDTNNRSPQEYLITDWAWMLVKEGTLLDVIDVNIRNESLKEVMERYVRVGILCAHLLVAYRPTMLQALRMLEGDEEIPEIPDRPLPLNYDSVISDVHDVSVYQSASENVV